MEEHLWYTSPAQDGDLTNLPGAEDGASVETNFARVTFRRQTGAEGLRLEVTSNAGALPSVQAQSNPVAENVARQIAETEEWIAVLGQSTIYLRGSTTSPCCSVTVPNAALQGRGDDFINGLLTVADNIISGVLRQLLGVAVTRVNPSN